MPQHQYIYAPARELWPASSVNGRLPERSDPITGEPIAPSVYLDANRAVEQMTWAPGEPVIVKDRLVSQGGWIPKPGGRVFNLYLGPQIEPGDANKPGPWLDLVHRLYPADDEHILDWFAHRVQKPHEKVNHALVLGGEQGIGKDTILEPVKRAVGAWNFSEVSPLQILGRFNGFLKSVVLRVSEARDLGDTDRLAFYDHLKVYIAAPPDVLRCDEKNIKEHAVFNVCGVIITTNYRTGGIYLPADDRRHFVAWSDLTKDDFDSDYWHRLWSWYYAEGVRHVAAYLAARDISGFDPKAPPPKTPAFWAIVDSSRAPESAELADALEKLGHPDAVTLVSIADVLSNLDDFAKWLLDRRNSRLIPHRLEEGGYVAVRNDAAKDGLWKVAGRRVAVYAKAALSLRDRIAAAHALTDSAQR
jgi:hypothetical protein